MQKAKSLAERKEAEVRQELLSLRKAVDGITAADFNRMERELRDVKQQNAQLQIEVEAAAEKISIYRTSQNLTSRGNSTIAGGTSGKPFISPEAPEQSLY